mgnify:FL=1
MESTDLAKIVMNPVRIRIAQYFLVHEQGTPAQIGEELSDVPKASLYRHMKIMEDAGLIRVVQENKKRGTVEKVYKLEQENPMGSREPGKEEVAQLIHSSLLGIMGEFQRYLKREDADPQKDMISLTSAVFLLTDEEFQEFFSKMGELYSSMINNQPDGKRRPRKLTLISSPVTEEKEKKKKEGSGREERTC